MTMAEGRKPGKKLAQRPEVELSVGKGACILSVCELGITRSPHKACDCEGTWAVFVPPILMLSL